MLLNLLVYSKTSRQIKQNNTKKKEFRCSSDVFQLKLDGKCPLIFTFASVLRKYPKLLEMNSETIAVGKTI